MDQRRRPVLKIETREFVPILLGSDINTYSMARAFYEEYGIKSVVIGKVNTGPSCNSRIVDFYDNPNLDRPEVFVKVINGFAAKFSDRRVLLLGCGDNYVEQIIKNRAQYSRNIIVPYVEESMMNDLLTKKKFYDMCDIHGIEYPSTLVYTRDMEDNFSLPFGFPVILKPSNGVMYWENGFASQKKVYRINDREELSKVIAQIYKAGYSDSLIIQDFVPGDDSFLRVMICYSGQDRKVRLMSMGHVLLEEHTPHGLGNTAAMINDYDPELSEKIRGFLDDISFLGFSTFDIKFDQRDHRYKILEINLRQGRSNYYVTGAGHNLAKYLIEDYIYNKEHCFEIADQEFLWTVIPLRVVQNYIKDEELQNRIGQLIKRKRVINPLFMKGDNGFKRLAYLFKSHLSHFLKYRKYYN